MIFAITDRRRRCLHTTWVILLNTSCNNLINEWWEIVQIEQRDWRRVNDYFPLDGKIEMNSRGRSWTEIEQEFMPEVLHILYILNVYWAIWILSCMNHGCYQTSLHYNRHRNRWTTVTPCEINFELYQVHIPPCYLPSHWWKGSLLPHNI